MVDLMRVDSISHNLPHILKALDAPYVTKVAEVLAVTDGFTIGEQAAASVRSSLQELATVAGKIAFDLSPLEL